MQVSIIIINYNTYDLTCQCISSVIQYTKDIEYEIILVDNASTEYGPQKFLDKFPIIKLVKSEINLGFAGGNNLGIKEAKGDYILLLNSDTYLIENSILTTWRYIINSGDIGAITCKIIYPNGKVQQCYNKFPSVRVNLFEFFRFQKVFKSYGEKFLLGPFYKSERPVEVDWIWGTYFMMPRSLLDKLSDRKLSETFFMYCEDMEWCMIFRQLGYKIYYLPCTSIIHLVGSSGAIESNLNKQKFLNMYYSRIHLALINFTHRLLEWSQLKIIL